MPFPDAGLLGGGGGGPGLAGWPIPDPAGLGAPPKAAAGLGLAPEFPELKATNGLGPALLLAGTNRFPPEFLKASLLDDPPKPDPGPLTELGPLLKVAEENPEGITEATSF